MQGRHNKIHTIKQTILFLVAVAFVSLKHKNYNERITIMSHELVSKMINWSRLQFMFNSIHFQKRRSHISQPTSVYKEILTVLPCTFQSGISLVTTHVVYRVEPAAHWAI